MNIRVKISSRSPHGFYRFGQKFPAAGKEVELTAEQFEVAKADPNLFVEVVPFTAAEARAQTIAALQQQTKAELSAFLKTEFGFEFEAGRKTTKDELLAKIAELQNADSDQQDGAE